MTRLDRVGYSITFQTATRKAGTTKWTALSGRESHLHSQREANQNTRPAAAEKPRSRRGGCLPIVTIQRKIPKTVAGFEAPNDPKTVKERGPHALLRFRMDFLLLMPQGARVVIEADGKNRYAHDDGRADCARYATMAAPIEH